MKGGTSFGETRNLSAPTATPKGDPVRDKYGNPLMIHEVETDATGATVSDYMNYARRKGPNNTRD